MRSLEKLEAGLVVGFELLELLAAFIIMFAVGIGTPLTFAALLGWLLS